MISGERKAALVAAAAEKAGIPTCLVERLLGLESDRRSLHGVNDRPALRRAATALIDEALSNEAGDSSR